MRVSAFLFVPCLVLALFTGCGKDDRVPVHPASGQIVYEGKPVPHALVILHPLGNADKAAPRPRGTVDKDGRFVLTTYDGNDGAPAGEYGVTVEWWLSNAKSGTAEGDGAPPTNRLPQRYASVATSKLRVRIQEGDNQLPLITLTR